MIYDQDRDHIQNVIKHWSQNLDFKKGNSA